MRIPKIKIKVKDKVRVLIDKPCLSYFKKGDTITVTEVSGNTLHGYTKQEGKEHTNFCRLEHVGPLRDPNKKLTQAERIQEEIEKLCDSLNSAER